MPIGPARMPLIDHLGDLRRRLTIVVVSVLAATVFMYFAAPTLVDILKDPINGSLQPGEQLSVMTSLGGFSIKFNIAIKVALAMCTPMIIWQILQPGEQLSVMTSLGGFSIKFNIAIKVALAMCTPMIIWQILASSSTSPSRSRSPCARP